MTSKIQQNFIIRKNFAKVKTELKIPNLIDIQQKSYAKFLQQNILPGNRKNFGLQAAFKSVFPIKDYNKIASLDFVSYHLDKPKFDYAECRSRGMTYASLMKIIVRLVIWNKNENSQTCLTLIIL